MNVEIITRLYDGIYRDVGGGQERVCFSWPAATADDADEIFQTFLEHVRDMREIYGTVGQGSSWVEVNGKEVRLVELHRVLELGRHLTAEDRAAVAAYYASL